MPTQSQIRVSDPVLSNVSIGYKNAEHVAQFLMPFLSSQKRGGKVVKFGKEAFKLYNTIRAMRAKSQRMNWSKIPSITLQLEDHTMEDVFDDEELTEQSSPIDLQTKAVNNTNDIIQLDREVSVANLAQDLATYPTGNKVTLSGTSQWSNPASTPKADIIAAREAIRSKIGRYPNTLLLGPITFTQLSEHADMVDKIKYSERGIVTPEIMAAVLDVDRVVVGKSVYANAADDFVDVWGKHAILAFVPESPARDMPAFGYTARLAGKPMVMTYREEPKLNVVYNEDVWQVLVTTAEAGYLIQDAVA